MPTYAYICFDMPIYKAPLLQLLHVNSQQIYQSLLMS